MIDMKVTGWISVLKLPVRTGVYQRKFYWGISFAHFDGRHWGLAASSPEQALARRATKSQWSLDSSPWRGLT